MGFLGWLKSKLGRKQEAPLISFVWLLGEPRMLDAPTVKRIVEQALDMQFPPESDEAQQFVVGEPPIFMVKLESLMIGVHCFPTPYFNNPETAAKRVGERRLQRIVSEHRAWIAVDLMGSPLNPDAPPWQTLGRIAAGLADDCCLGLFVPATDRCFPYAEELLDQLRSDNPLEELSWQIAPVINISGDDPWMRAAVSEARACWPEFVEAFHNPRPGQQNFTVKLPISDGRHTEFIWVNVVAIEGDVISGDLGNEPVDLQFMALGDRVRGKVEDLNDWIFIDNGEMVGGFTTAILMNA